MNEPIPVKTEEITSAVLNAAFRVHKNLGPGPGLLESNYERCLCHELAKAGIAHEAQASLPILYDGEPIDGGLRLDVLVEGVLVVEVKAVEGLLSIHQAQVLTYLKLSRCRIGLLLKFDAELLRDGIKRVVL